jgi:hypothetical protein
MTTNIGIYFWGCNKLDRLASEYILLSLNKQQSLFEYEIHNPKSFLEGPYISGRVDFDDDTIFKQFKCRFKLYKDEINKKNNEVNDNFVPLNNSIAEYSIAIIEKKVKDEFYYVCDRPFIIISIGDWKKKYAPPSIIEFLLSTIITASIDLLDTKDQLPMHLATKGCLFDYNRKLESARYCVLTNHICYECRERIRELLGNEFLKELKKITERDWIGISDDKGSVAYNLKRVFYYDLNKTKGFKATFISKMLQKFSVLFTEAAVKIIILIIFGLLLGILGFTSILEFIK